MTAKQEKYLTIGLLLTGFTLFIGCGIALYGAPPHLFINQQDCFQTVCVAKFTEQSRAILVGIAYGIPVGLLAMIYACSRLRARNDEITPG